MGVNQSINRVWTKSSNSLENLVKAGKTVAECDCFRSGNFSASFAYPDGNLFDVDSSISINLQQWDYKSTERYCRNW